MKTATVREAVAVFDDPNRLENAVERWFDDSPR